MSDLLHKGLHTLLCVFCLEITLKMNSCSLLSLRSRQGSHRWRICSQTCVMDDVCCSCWSSWLDISWYDHVHSRACPESEVALKAISSFVMSTTYYEGNNLCFRKWLLLCQLLTLGDRNEWKCRFCESKKATCQIEIGLLTEHIALSWSGAVLRTRGRRWAGLSGPAAVSF